MSFNHDPKKQAQEVIFSRETTKKIHPKIFFNNNPVTKANFQKHSGLHLDSKLSFDIHIKIILTKVNRTINYQQVLPTPSLISIYKAFKGPQLDYGDITFDQTFNYSFHQRLESIQYNANRNLVSSPCSPEEAFQGLSLFYKIIKNESPLYLCHLIPKPLAFDS